MTISYPINLLPGFPGWTTGFSLRWRQEQSTQASGRVLVKDMGSPLWTLRATTKTLSPNTLDLWRAKLTALENGLQTFWGYPMSRCYPQAYPNGSWPTGGAFPGTTAQLASIDTNRKLISVSHLPAGFILSVGDYLSIAGDLHQVMEAATATAGTTGFFEVRPHIWPGRAIGATVSVKQPACLMAVVPDTVSADASLNGWGTLSFQAMEARL
jgi:hypothetical protein